MENKQKSDPQTSTPKIVKIGSEKWQQLELPLRSGHTRVIRRKRQPEQKKR